MKKLLIILAVLLLFTACEKKTYYSEEAISSMKITNIVYFDAEPSVLSMKVDSITRNTLCIYQVRFLNSTIVGETGFSFIDSIGKYKINDKFPKIK